MDVDDKLMELIAEELKRVKDIYNSMVKIMWDAGNFLNRIQTTGIIRKQTAEDLAMVGVGGRASGLTRDSRKDMGFGLYDELDFKVISKTNGDVEARIQVRIEEVEQSMDIIRQVLYLLRQDKTELRVDLGELKGLEGAWGISESPRGDNLQWLILNAEGQIERLFVRSASYPNWPALPIAVQGDIIPDFPLINKSFELCYACIDR